MPSFVDRFAYTISGKSRARKWEGFLSLIAPQPEETILDIGVNTTEYSDGDNYLESHYPYPEKITAVGIDEDFSEFSKKYPQVRTISSDGRSLPFSENEFDICYSNAVIEHVGDWEDQKRFVSEMYRVGKRGYLTTPNRFFPVEVHTRVPLLHIFLPKTFFDSFLKLIGKSWATGSYMRLLSEHDLRCLLAENGIEHSMVTKNRFCGFTMTFTVVWQKK